MKIVDLLRHGELQGGMKYRGRTDDPLTVAGRRGMDAVWQQLSGKVDAIACSPLGRCLEPARTWAAAAGLPLWADERLAEMHYGDWEGLTAEQIEDRYPGMLEAWRRDPTGMRPPGGESPEELRERLADWWRDVVDGGDFRHLLVVSHSGCQRMLLALALDAPVAATRRFSMPYACWSRIAAGEGAPVLDFHMRQADAGCVAQRG